MAGTIRVPKVGRAKARTYKLKAVAGALAIGGKGTVRLKLSKTVRSAVRRALRARKRVTVKVVARVGNRAGVARALTRSVRLKL